MLKSLLKYIRGLSFNFLDLLAPESAKIRKLLDTPPEILKQILPKSKTQVNDILVLFDYENGVVRLIIKTVKYKNNFNLRKLLAIFLYDEILEFVSEIALFDGGNPIIVPMPMSNKERRVKGFNQCEEILKELKKLDASFLMNFNILKKVRETKRQTTLNRGERLLNVTNSMQVAEEQEPKVKNRTTIVFDDIYTTMATFNEAKRALNEAGAKRVVGIFLAH